MVLDVSLLDNYQLLRQELVSEEFKHLICKFLLAEGGLSPLTEDDREAEELHTDLQKMQDFLFRDFDEQFQIIAGIIKEPVRQPFYTFLLRILPPDKMDRMIVELRHREIIDQGQVQE